MDKNIGKTQKIQLHIVSGSCFLGHKWTKWQQYKQPLIDKSTLQYTYENRQNRFCLKCGKMQDEYIS
jgi:hypothetical protein